MILPLCGDDEIGSHTGLKIPRRKACGFESRSPHQPANCFFLHHRMSVETDHFVGDLLAGAVVGGGAAAFLGWLLSLRGKPMLLLLVVCVYGGFAWSRANRAKSNAKALQADIERRAEP